MLKNLIKKRNKRGFTLVEVIIVLVILAILAAVLIQTLTGYIDRANKAKYMLAAKNCMKAMQVELSEMYAERGTIDPTNNSKQHDVNYIGTDFAKEILKTADDNPYMLIFGLGDYTKYIETDPHKAYTVYFVVYWPTKEEKPIFFNGSEWVEKYPWKGTGQNTFKVNGEDIPMQFYFITGPSKNMSNNWNELKARINAK